MSPLKDQTLSITSTKYKTPTEQFLQALHEQVSLVQLERFACWYDTVDRLNKHGEKLLAIADKLNCRKQTVAELQKLNRPVPSKYGIFVKARHQIAEGKRMARLRIPLRIRSALAVLAGAAVQIMGLLRTKRHHPPADLMITGTGGGPPWSWVALKSRITKRNLE
jgi:hypothetical protein